MKTGRPPIIDEFTDLKVSRQRKKALRNIKDGNCQCGNKPLKDSYHCLKCMIYIREHRRVHKKSKIVYPNCKSRLAEQKGK